MLGCDIATLHIAYAFIIKYFVIKKGHCLCQTLYNGGIKEDIETSSKVLQLATSENIEISQ